MEPVASIGGVIDFLDIRVEARTTIIFSGIPTTCIFQAK
jgi:hypothetical protein